MQSPALLLPHPLLYSPFVVQVRQEEHAAFPVPTAYCGIPLTGSHQEHDASAVLGPYFPAWHGSHCVDPGDDENDPVGHELHTDAPDAEKYPASH